MSQVHALKTIKISRLIKIGVLIILLFYCGSYVHKRMTHQMVHYKVACEIRCNLRPPIDGPTVFVNMIMVENSDISEDEKRKKQIALDQYIQGFEKMNEFNKIVYWIPRKVEEFYWRMKKNWL